MNINFFSRIPKGKDSLAFPSILLGLSCWIAWVFCIYSGDPFKVFNGQFFEPTSDAFLFSTSALAICLILFSRFPNASYQLIKNTPIMILLGALAGVFTFFEVLPEVIETFMFPLFAAGTGVCTSAIALRAASRISELRTKDALIVLASGQIGGVFIYSFIFMLTKSNLELLSLILLCVLPLLSAIFLLLDVTDRKDSLKVSPLSVPKSFWKLLVAVFILSMGFSLIRGYFPSVLNAEGFDLSRSLTAFFLLLILITIIGVVSYLPANSNFGNLSYIILIGASALVVFVPIVGIGSMLIGSLAVALLAISFYAVWGILACIAHKSGASVIKVFGFGFGVAALGSALGVFIGNTLHLSTTVDHPIMNVVGVILVIASVIVALLFLNKNDINQLMIPVIESEPESSGDQGIVTNEVKPKFKIRCLQIADRYSLTPRETEVMLLMAKGKDARTISDSLFISFNTTRTHIKNVYTKLEVHNRGEFINLIDCEKLDTE